MIRIQYTVSQKDVWESERAQRGWQLGVLPFSGGFLILWGIYMLLEDPGKFGLAIAAVLVGVFVGFGIRLAVFYSYRRDKRLHDKFVATFSEEKVEVESAVASSKLEWRAFTRQLETEHLFLLYQGPACVNIFPKNSFDPGQVDAFRKLVQEKIRVGAGMDRRGLRPATWAFIAVGLASLVLLLMTIRNILREAPSQPPPTESTQ